MDSSYTALEANENIRNFCILQQEELKRLGKELALVLPTPALAFLQRVYRRSAVLRNPTVAELRLFDGYFRFYRASSEGARISAVRGLDGALSDVRADICEKLRLFDVKKPPTLGEITELSSKILHRAGVRYKTDGLFTGSLADVALHTYEKKPALTLELASAAATLIESAPQKENGEMLFMLTPRHDEPILSQISDFLKAHRGMQITPLAVTGSEGIFPHLAAQKEGLDVDYSLFPEYALMDTPDLLLKIGQNVLLFFVPKHISPLLLAERDPRLLLFASRTHDHRLTLRAGKGASLSLSTEIYEALHISTIKTLTLTPNASDDFTVRSAKNGKQLLVGASTEQDAIGAICAALATAVEENAELRSVRLHTVLELPENDASFTATAAALPLVFEVYRAVTEAVIPQSSHKELTNPTLTRPRLSIFFLANLKESGTETEKEQAKSVMQSRRFSLIRRFIYEKK